MPPEPAATPAAAGAACSAAATPRRTVWRAAFYVFIPNTHSPAPSLPFIISWADMYDSASMEAKKMIVSCLIKRVDVYRDYKLYIDFNIDFEQFGAGLDISAITA